METGRRQIVQAGAAAAVAAPLLRANPAAAGMDKVFQFSCVVVLYLFMYEVLHIHVFLHLV